jgi:hypothetical protein
MEEKVVQLMEKICDVVNDAAALGIDLKPICDDAARQVMRATPRLQREDVRKILDAFRRPQSAAIQ